MYQTRLWSEEMYQYLRPLKSQFYLCIKRRQEGIDKSIMVWTYNLYSARGKTSGQNCRESSLPPITHISQLTSFRRKKLDLCGSNWTIYLLPNITLIFKECNKNQKPIQKGFQCLTSIASEPKHKIAQLFGTWIRILPPNIRILVGSSQWFIWKYESCI